MSHQSATVSGMPRQNRNPSTRDRLISQQAQWALSAGLQLDSKNYCEKYSLNLRRPLSPAMYAAYDSGSGSELQDKRQSPAKMRALHSSSALVVNVFGYWEDRETSVLAGALGVPCIVPPIRFEEQFPTGLKGTPPHLDCTITLESGKTIAIESKFCEWLTPKSDTKLPFKDKYFPKAAALWAERGLQACQSLAEDVQQRKETFRFLDVAQLLKHALGLSAQIPGRFELWYLYFDSAGVESVQHQNEIERLADRIGKEVGFSCLTYQELFSRLRASKRPDPDYLEYLQTRYFPQIPVQ